MRWGTCPRPSADWTPTRCRDALATLAETFQNTPPDLRAAVQGVGPVLRDSRGARHRTAQPAEQRQQGHRGAVRTRRPGRRTRRQQQCAAGRADRAKLGAGADLAEPVDLRPAAVGVHRRQPPADAPGAGQAQRGPDDRRQPQGTHHAGDQVPQPVHDVAGRDGRARGRSSRPTWPTCPARSCSRSSTAAFSDLGLDPNVLPPSELYGSADRPGRHTGSAAAPSRAPVRVGNRTSRSARCDHRQSG